MLKSIWGFAYGGRGTPPHNRFLHSKLTQWVAMWLRKPLTNLPSCLLRAANHVLFYLIDTFNQATLAVVVRAI